MMSATLGTRHDVRRWSCALGLMLTVVLMLFVVVCPLFFLTDDTGRNSTVRRRAQGSATGSPSLSARLCNGLAHQRMGIVFTILLAKELDRDLFLPDIQPHYAQQSAQGQDRSSKIEEVYDVDALRKVLLKTHHIRVMPADARRPTSAELRHAACGGRRYCCVQDLSAGYGRAQHVVIDCPYPDAPTGKLVLDNQNLVKHALAAMQPVAWLEEVVDDVANAVLAGGSEADGFSLVHLSIDRHWLDHCKMLQDNMQHAVQAVAADPYPLGLLNCFNYSLSLDGIFGLLSLQRQEPVYMAADWENVSAKVRLLAISKLSNAGYRVLTWDDVSRHVQSAIRLSHDQRILVQYFLALRARTFIGNSVSDFSALAAGERALTNAGPSFFYNGGEVLLANHFPIFAAPPQ